MPQKDLNHHLSRTASLFTLDKDKLIRSIYRISTFLTSPYSADEISQNIFVSDDFYRTAGIPNSGPYVDNIVTKILDETVDSLGFDRGIICFLDESRENLLTKVVKNYDAEETRRAMSSPLNLVRHDCLETRVAKTGQYIILEDPENDPRLTPIDRKITKFYKRGSTFYAPFNIDDEVIGIIAVWTKEKTRFSQEEIDTLLTFANQISIIIHLTRLFENNRDKIHQLLLLQKAAAELNGSYLIESLHEILLRNAQNLAGAERSLLYFIDEENFECFVRHGEGIKVCQDCGPRTERSIIKKAMKTEAITIQAPMPGSAMDTRPIFDGFGSEIALPLKIKDKFRGVLYLSKAEGGYSQDQINALDILVKNAAASYDNAIMHSLLSLEAKSLKSEVEKLKEREDLLLGFHDIVGKSKQMQGIFHIIQEVAKHDTNILIQGESGTGKELIARAIHRQSERSPKRFVEVNCAAIPGTLLESELFGYEAGAFTDAKRRKLGLLEYAHGGTFLLDEIGDMSLPLQAKFLRMLEDGHIRRLGGNENIPIDVRFVFSTNKDLAKMVAAGSFREDLFYRIRVVPIMLPPLRDRGDDIILLARYYVEEFNRKLNKKVRGFSKKAEEILKNYHWPGNVRELRNIIERIMILQNLGKVILPENLPAELTQTARMDLSGLIPDLSHNIDFKSTVDKLTNEIRERILASALERGKGKKSAAARLLGISRYTMLRELKKIGKA